MLRYLLHKKSQQSVKSFSWFQVLLAASVLEGSLTLPSTEEMLEDQENDYQKRVADGLPIRFVFVIFHSRVYFRICLLQVFITATL